MLQNTLQKFDISGQADDLVVCQSLLKSEDGLVSRVSMHDHLGNHRVVERRNGVTLSDTSINTQVLVLHGLSQYADLSALGQEPVLGVLSVDASLDSVTDQRHVHLRRDRQSFSSSHSQLPLDQVETRDHFSDGMLDLQTSVHLHKVEAVIRRVENEFNRACVVVANGLSGSNSRLTDLKSELRGNAGRGLLDDLLVAALHRAITLVQVDVVTVFVSENLHFNVSRPLDVFFNNHVVVVEAFARLIFGRLKSVHKFRLLADNAHAFAATTERCFKHNRETDFFSFCKQDLRVFALTVVAGHKGHSSSLHDSL